MSKDNVKRAKRFDIANKVAQCCGSLDRATALLRTIMDSGVGYDDANNELNSLLTNYFSEKSIFDKYYYKNATYFKENFQAVEDGEKCEYEGSDPEAVDEFVIWNDLDALCDLTNNSKGMIKNLVACFENDFKLISAHKNLVDAKFDKDLYDRVNQALISVNDFVNMDIGKVTTEEFSQLFHEHVKSELFLKNQFTGKSSFDMATYTKMKAVGSYIAKMKHILKKNKEIAATLEASKLAKAVEQHGDICSKYVFALNVSLREFVDVVNTYSGLCNDLATKFADGNDEAPFCYMNKLSNVEKVKGSRYFSGIYAGEPKDAENYYKGICDSIIDATIKKYKECVGKK